MNKLRCKMCGELFENDDPDITQEAVDDPEFLVTCSKPGCIDGGFIQMGWKQQLNAQPGSSPDSAKVRRAGDFNVLRKKN